MASTHEFILRVAEAFKCGDGRAVAELYEPDAILHHPRLGPVVGRDAIAATESGVFESYSDQEWVPEETLVDGRVIAVRYTLDATNSGPMPMSDGTMAPPTNRRVGIRGASFFRLSEQGLIAEEHRYMGSEALRMKLGYEPL